MLHIRREVRGILLADRPLSLLWRVWWFEQRDTFCSAWLTVDTTRLDGDGCLSDSSSLITFSSAASDLPSLSRPVDGKGKAWTSMGGKKRIIGARWPEAEVGLLAESSAIVLQAGEVNDQEIGKSHGVEGIEFHLQTLSLCPRTTNVLPLQLLSTFFA